MLLNALSPRDVILYKPYTVTIQIPIPIQMISVMFHFMLFIVLLVQFGLLSGHLLGNSCPLGLQFVLIVFCLFVIFIYFPFWF